MQVAEGLWSTPLADAEISLATAGHQAAAGDREAVARLLDLARAQARRELQARDRWFVVWPEWARFEEACVLEGLTGAFPIAALLRRRVRCACLAFLDLAARAERAAAPNSTPSLGDALEDLRVQVLLCEREWRLDDRIDASLGISRSRLSPARRRD